MNSKNKGKNWDSLFSQMERANEGEILWKDTFFSTGK